MLNLPIFHPSFPHILVKSNAGLFLKSWIFFLNYLFVIAIYDFSMAILKNSTQTYCNNYRKSWNMQHHLANYNKNLTRQRIVLRKKWRSINIIDFLQGFLRKIKDNHGFCKKSKNQLDNRLKKHSRKHNLQKAKHASYIYIFMFIFFP